MTLPYQNGWNGRGDLRCIRLENRLARTQLDGGLDVVEKTAEKSLLFIDDKSVILSKLNEVHDVVDVELLLESGKLSVDSSFTH